MFGLFMLIGSALSSLIGIAKENIDNDIGRKERITPDGLCYIDSKARTRLLRNNRLVDYAHDKNGDYILIDILNRTVYKNFTEEERKKEYQNGIEIMKRNNNRFYFINKDDHRKEECKGVRFIDKYTNEEYVVRKIKNVCYFMRVKDNIICEETDYQQYHRKKHPTLYDLKDGIEDLKQFNKIYSDTTINWAWNSMEDYSEIKYLEGGYE